MHIGNDLLQNLQTLTFKLATFEASLADLGEVYNRFVLKTFGMDLHGYHDVFGIPFFCGGRNRDSNKTIISSQNPDDSSL